MKRWLVTLLLLLFMGGSVYANQRSLTFLESATDAKMATGPLRLKQVFISPTGNNSIVHVQDSLTKAFGDTKLTLRGPATDDKVTRPYSFGDNEDFLLMYDGVYCDVTSATVTIVILGDGLTTVTNGGSTTKTKRDPQTGVTYSIPAAGAATVRDSFAVWWGIQDSDLTLSAN